MKKKLLITCAVLLCAMGLAACGKDASEDAQTVEEATETPAETNDNVSADAGNPEEVNVLSDRTMPEGLVDIYVSSGNVADFVFHADKSGVKDFKSISYRFGEYEISLSDFGTGYQCSTWNVDDDGAELAEEEDYVIDGSDYVIKAYITSIVPCFDTMDGTYELYYESRDGETYFYDLVWKDVVKQGDYVEGSKTGAGVNDGNMTFADIPSGEYVGETQSNGECSSFYFSSEGLGTYSTQFRLKNGDEAIIDNIDITPELVVDNGPDYVEIIGANGSFTFTIVFSKDGEAKVKATNRDGLTITDTLHVR